MKRIIQVTGAACTRYAIVLYSPSNKRMFLSATRLTRPAPTQSFYNTHLQKISNAELWDIASFFEQSIVRVSGPFQFVADHGHDEVGWWCQGHFTTTQTGV